MPTIFIGDLIQLVLDYFLSFFTIMQSQDTLAGINQDLFFSFFESENALTAVVLSPEEQIGLCQTRHKLASSTWIWRTLLLKFKSLGMRKLGQSLLHTLLFLHE